MHPNYIKHAVNTAVQAAGNLHLTSKLSLGPVAVNTGEWLHRWANERPNQVFMMERSGDGWRGITYQEILEQVHAAAASLLAIGLDTESKIMMLSGPSIDHAVLMLAAQYVGIATVPLAEQYSLVPEANARLDYCVQKIKPTLVYAHDAEKFNAALERETLVSTQKLVSVGGGENLLRFEQFLNTTAHNSVVQAHKQVGLDSLAKILFTSGSTGNPKGVPQTQGMMTVNQAQYLSCLPLLAARPPVIVDWLPWNHVFAGNSNFNMILSNGGTLVLDDGKPVKGLFERTLENLSMQVGTLSFNVPIAYTMLVDAFRKDKRLKERFFSDLDMIFYAGASLPVDIWSALENMSKEVTGSVPMMTSSWGLTETAPACLMHYEGGAESGMIGVPVPELEAKLIPYQGNRYEIRVKGPNVISCYFDEPEKDALAFDEDGYFITGDAIKFVDESHPEKGLQFDGRITEDFKLLTGTWVQSAIIRLNALNALDDLVQDVVVTGADRTDIGLLVFPAPALALEQDESVVLDESFRKNIIDRLRLLSEKSTGSSNRIRRALILSQSPSVENAEITAKGSLNISAVLANRPELLARLYDDDDPACLLI